VAALNRDLFVAMPLCEAAMPDLRQPLMRRQRALITPNPFKSHAYPPSHRVGDYSHVHPTA
jgi:hypothetical protein